MRPAAHAALAMDMVLQILNGDRQRGSVSVPGGWQGGRGDPGEFSSTCIKATTL